MSQAQSLRARIAARVGRLVVEVELDTGPGTLVLVGPNGAGKSSLLSLLLGVLPVDRGRIAVGEAVLLESATAIDVPLEHRRLGYVPAPRSIFRGIRKPPPASLTIVERGRVEERIYWRLPETIDSRRSEGDWIEAVRARLETSVAIYVATVVAVLFLF